MIQHKVRRVEVVNEFQVHLSYPRKAVVVLYLGKTSVGTASSTPIDTSQTPSSLAPTVSTCPASQLLHLPYNHGRSRAPMTLSPESRANTPKAGIISSCFPLSQLGRSLSSDNETSPRSSLYWHSVGLPGRKKHVLTSLRGSFASWVKYR